MYMHVRWHRLLTSQSFQSRKQRDFVSSGVRLCEVLNSEPCKSLSVYIAAIQTYTSDISDVWLKYSHEHM
jgi:hypothetical protein